LLRFQPECRPWSRFASVLLVFLGCLANSPCQTASQNPASSDPSQIKSQSSSQTAAQATSQSASSNPFKLEIESNLVVVRVVVRDGQGHAVADLRQEDFKLSDNGKEQSISQFAVETSSTQSPAATTPASPAFGVPRYLALYFDDLEMSPDEIMHARDAADRYLSKSLGASDHAGIFTSSGLAQVDFTSDLKKLHDALFKLQSNSRLNNNCPNISDYQAKLIVEQTSPSDIQRSGPKGGPTPASDALAVALDEAKNVCHMLGANGRIILMKAQQIRGQAVWQAQYSLQGLKDIVNHASDMPGQRSVVFMSPGFLTDELGSQISAIADRALHSQVVVGSIDSKGLATMLQEADIRTSYTTVDSHLLAVKRDLAKSREQSALSVLEEVAGDTGGRFIHNDNDLEAGIRAASTLSEISYILAFSPSNLKPDGRFHSIKVTLHEKRKGIALQARRGYFAPLAGAKPTDELAEAMRSAVLSREDVRGLPLDITTEISRGTGENAGKAELGIMARVEVGRVHFRKDGDHNLNTLTFVSSVFDHDGLWVGGQQKKLPLDLPDDKLQQLMNSPGVLMRSAFHLAPGTYSIREVVMDSEDRHIGAVTRSVEVPDFQTKSSNHPAQ
jgi:VWFA-related protein